MDIEREKELKKEIKTEGGVKDGEQSYGKIKIDIRILEEILQNGYPIKANIPKETICKYCNKVLKPRGILNPINKTINVFIENEKCDCKQAREEREKAKEKLQEELMKQYENFRKEEYNKKIKQYYGTDFITKQFKQKTLENFITDVQNIKTKLAAQNF